MRIAAIAVALALSQGCALADELHSECRWSHGDERVSVRCRSYWTPDLTSAPQIIAVPRNDDALVARCRPRVVSVDELGVEHVEFMNKSEECGQ